MPILKLISLFSELADTSIMQHSYLLANAMNILNFLAGLESNIGEELSRTVKFLKEKIRKR